MFNDFEISQEYIKIAASLDNALGKGKLIDSNCIGENYSFQYYTPHEIASAIDLLIASINDRVEDTFPLYRRTYLLDQLYALKLMVALDEKNVSLDYHAITKVLLGIDIEKPDIEEIEELKSRISILLDNEGFTGESFSDKLKSWKKANSISNDELINEIHMEYEECKRLVDSKITPLLFKEIPDAFDKANVLFEFKDSSAEGWTAYNYYLGNYTSKIVFNSKKEHHKPMIRHLIEHEVLPGHHYYNLLDEINLKNNVLPLESGVKLLNTPECVLMEGSADAGDEMLGINNDNIASLISEYYKKIHYYVSYKASIENWDDNEIVNSYLGFEEISNESAVQSLNFYRNWKYYFPVYVNGKNIFNQYLLEDRDNAIKFLFMGLTTPNTMRKRMNHIKTNKNEDGHDC